MSTSLLILALGGGAGTLTGIVFYRYMSARKRYFSELNRYLDHLVSDLKYRRTDIVSLTEAFDTADDDLKKNLREYIGGLGSGEHKLTRGKLKAAELTEVENILFGLGRVDIDAQMFELARAKEIASGMESAAAERFKKYGTLYIKLGLLAGLALGILLM